MRYKFSGTFRDGSGNIVSGGTVSVYASGTTTAASIYETETGTAIVNSTTTGTDGTFAFYILEGDYYGDHTRKIVLSKDGYTSKTYDYVDPTEFVNGPFTQANIIDSLTAIGTSNKATLLLRPVTWVISSNANWSAYTNVTFKIVPGAVFSGAFTITFPASTTAYPEWFSDADYGARINQAINSVTTNGGFVEITTGGSFATTIELTGAVVHFNSLTLTYTGTGTAVKNKTGVRPGSFTGLSLTTTANWTNANLIGLYLTGAYKCNGTIAGIDNFTTGFKLSSTAATLGSAYNTFTLGNFSVNKISLHVHMAATDGWTNENKFYGGSFSPGSAAPAGSIGIKLESTSSSAADHNVFFSPSLESWETAIQCTYAQNNIFFTPRFEANTTDVSYNSDSIKNHLIAPNDFAPTVVDNSTIEYGRNFETLGRLNFGTNRYKRTITSDAIAANSYGYITVEPETGATDNLKTITGGRTGDLILLQLESPSYFITIKNGTGNITLDGSSDLVLTSLDKLILFYNGSAWVQMGGYGINRSGDQLISVTTVSLAANADTTLYTVPTGRVLIPTKAILVVGADAGTSVISIGQDTAETDFIPNNTLSNLDVSGDVAILMPIPSTTPAVIKQYIATKVIQARVSSQAGGATNTLYLFGYLY